MNTLDTLLHGQPTAQAQTHWLIDGKPAPFDPAGELVVGPHSSALLLCLQQLPPESSHHLHLHIRLQAGARLQCFLLSLHGSHIQNLLQVDLEGEGADACLYGLFLGSGRQRLSNHLTLHHKVPHTTSSQLFKGILGEQAQGSFDGLIHVYPGAQQIAAYQANHNLLLSQEAKVRTNPQLEIYADDVKCSHGASIGRLDPEALFYLRARGISLAQARLLQQMAFVQDVLDPLPTPELRAQITQAVEDRLRGMVVAL